MKKHEQEFTTEWMKWARVNKKLLPLAAAIEIKVCLEPSMQFTDVKDHQIESMLIAKWSAYCYKISDMDRMQKPNDVVWMRDAGGFLVIYYKHKVGRGWNKEFFCIDVDVFIQEMENSTRKSLTEDRAKKIAFLIGKLN